MVTGVADLPPVPLIGVTDERLRTTSLCLSVGSGSRHDPPGRGGIAHLLEHLLMSSPMAGGTCLSETVERVGGQANARTGLDRMQFYAQVHADDAGAVAEHLLTAVLRPRFDHGGLCGERAVVHQELIAAAADPSDTVQDALLAGLFPGHPLGRPVGGTHDELDAVTVEDLTTAHRQFLEQSPAVLVVVGPRIPDELRTSAAEAVPAAPTDPSELPPPLPSPGPTDRPDARFSWLCYGARSPRAGSPGQPAHTVLALLLGSSPASLLYRTLRVRDGLTYAFQAWDRGYQEAGAWRLLIGAEPGAVTRIDRTVRELLRELAGPGPTPADLDAARRQAEMRLLLDAENPAEYAQLIGDRTASGARSWRLEDEIAALRRVSADDVRRAATGVGAGLRLAVRSQGAS